MARTPEEYDVVQILRQLAGQHLPVGSRGTVVMDYTKYNRPKSNDLPSGYEVEFTDHEGGTVALVTIFGTDLEVVWREGIGWLPGFGPDD